MKHRIYIDNEFVTDLLKLFIIFLFGVIVVLLINSKEPKEKLIINDSHFIYDTIIVDTNQYIITGKIIIKRDE